MLAVIAPGQGAQRPGQLAPWCEDPRLSALLEIWEQSTGLTLRHWGTDADADEIRATAVTQPLLAATALLSAAALSDAAPCDLAAAVVTGHSVGEWSAAVLADVLDPVTALRLVGVRGRAMGECAAVEPTAMAAVLGGDGTQVLAAIAAAGLVVANHNGGGQIVAAGRSADLVSFAATPPAGARVRPLAVEAAFHSPFMAPARGALADATQGLAVREPSVAVISNADGEVLLGGREVLARLVSQVTSPVRWDLCVARLGALGVTAVLELAPGGVLGPMVRRALPQVEVLALRSPEDLPAARAMLAEHAGAAVGAWA